MDWAESDLRAGLEAAALAERDAAAGFRPVGVDQSAWMHLFEELMRRGWVDVDHPLKGDGGLVAVRGIHVSSMGRIQLGHWRDSPSDTATPATPNEAWSKLRARAEPYSPFARRIADAMGDLESRGMFQSGQSIRRAMEVAYDENLVWSQDEGEFKARAPLAVEGSEHMTLERVADPRKVFVVHGRDEEAAKALFDYLRALNLFPLEWEQVVALTGTGSPYIGDVLAQGFREAQAVVVLFTPDDEARLHPSLRGADEPQYEVELTCQPRPNVLIEAGMALALHPERTIIVQVGHIRPATDLGGRHVLRLGPSGNSHALAQRLATAGCPCDLTTREVTNDVAFANLSAQSRQPTSEGGPRLPGSAGGIGTEVSANPSASPKLAARLLDRGDNNYVLEVQNVGGVGLTDVHWSLPAEGENWSVMAEVLPEYPIASLEPGENVRVPVAISLGGPAALRAEFIGTTPAGAEYRVKSVLSVY